jgi:hypothetical protein
VSKPKTKVKPHVRVLDQDVPADPLHPDRLLCRCGLPADHPSHTMPDPVADVRSVAAGDS